MKSYYFKFHFHFTIAIPVFRRKVNPVAMNIMMQSKFKLSLSMQKNKIIEVYSGTLWEANLLKSILESAGVDCFIKNSTLNTYAYKPIISEGAKVMILESDLKEAGKIIEDFGSLRNFEK